MLSTWTMEAVAHVHHCKLAEYPSSSRANLSTFERSNFWITAFITIQTTASISVSAHYQLYSVQK